MVQQHGTNCLMVAGLPQLMFRLCLAVQRQAILETHQLQNKQSAKMSRPPLVDALERTFNEAVVLWEV